MSRSNRRSSPDRSPNSDTLWERVDSTMRTLTWSLLLLAFQPSHSPTMSDLMVKIIYPASDSIFYITTRTPGTDAEWAALQKNTEALEQAARELIEPRRARDRERWLADAQMMVDASVKAVAAAKTRDLKGLDDLNDALYTSCVQCHQHYRPNYGRRSLPVARGPERPATPGGTDIT